MNIKPSFDHTFHCIPEMVEDTYREEATNDWTKTFKTLLNNGD